jgi:hypothetical protein
LDGDTNKRTGYHDDSRIIGMPNQHDASDLLMEIVHPEHMNLLLSEGNDRGKRIVDN